MIDPDDYFGPVERRPCSERNMSKAPEIVMVAERLAGGCLLYRFETWRAGPDVRQGGGGDIA
jgi:hypothetical protein